MAIATGTALALGAAGTAAAAALDYKSTKDASKRAQQQRRESQDFIERQMRQARGDIFKLFPSAQKSRQQGIQAGLDFYRQAIPQQLQAFQQGNMNAQQQLIGGLPQFNNAILGNAVDYSSFRPQQVSAGLQLPQSIPQGEGINQVMEQQPQVSEEQLAQMANSGFFGSGRLR